MLYLFKQDVLIVCETKSRGGQIYVIARLSKLLVR